jgi:hypothetical protein
MKKASLNIWDERIPLITDDNYDELGVNEIEQEEADSMDYFPFCKFRARPDGVSKVFLMLHSTNPRLQAIYHT